MNKKKIATKIELKGDSAKNNNDLHRKKSTNEQEPKIIIDDELKSVISVEKPPRSHNLFQKFE